MSTRRRILYLHQHFSTPAGSTATRAHAQARALAQAGHAVTLLCGRQEGAVTGLCGPFRFGWREGRVDGFTVREFDIPYGNAMSLPARTGAFLRFAARAVPAARRAPSLTIASSTPLTVVLPALAAPATPFLFEMRDPWPELPAALGLRSGALLSVMSRLADAACRRAACVVALSEGMAEIAHARGARTVEVIGQGCDLDIFQPGRDPWRPPEARPQEMLAVYAGAHGAANGLDALLAAAANLQERREGRVRLLLVGDGAAAPALRRAASGLANVSFLGPLPKRDLARLLAGSQVGLLCLAPVPEFAEWTAPNKLMDLLAAGLPVVSNVPGAAARLLAEGACGVTAMTPTGLADALAGLAASPTRRIAMGNAARRLAETRFDRRLLTARFVTACEAAMA